MPGGVEFTGDWQVCYRLNLESRIATRVLWRLGEGAYRQGRRHLSTGAGDMDWAGLFDVDQTIRIYVTAQRSPLKSLEFITLRVKDAVCDRFRDATGRRPSVNTKTPDVRIHLFLTEQRATLYLDTSGEPLWQRGHKIAKVGAPLKENLAAGILRLAGWQPGVPLLDPMCGSGTFLLEAAQIALDDAPGLGREPGEFGFERLGGFDAAALAPPPDRGGGPAAAGGRRCPSGAPTHPPMPSPAPPQNLAHAGLDDLVAVERADLLDRAAPAPSGMLVANPPYGERLGDADELAAFYPTLGDALKQKFCRLGLLVAVGRHAPAQADRPEANAQDPALQRRAGMPPLRLPHGRREQSLDDVEVLDAGGEVAVLRLLAVQLDLQAHFVHRIGVAQRILVADLAALVEIEQRLVEGLHAQFARLLHDLLDLVRPRP